jgi:hypothetical protein
MESWQDRIPVSSFGIPVDVFEAVGDGNHRFPVHKIFMTKRPQKAKV